MVFYLVDLKIYADGHMDCLGEIDMNKLKRLFASGKLCWKMPPNETLFIPYISRIWTSNYQNRQESDDFIFKVIENKIEELKNGVSINSLCIDEFRQYLIEPSDHNFLKLKNTFSQLPSDKRALFEHPPKDALLKLMETEEHPSREEREYYLRDYFEGQWLELK